MSGRTRPPLSVYRPTAVHTVVDTHEVEVMSTSGLALEALPGSGASVATQLPAVAPAGAAASAATQRAAQARQQSGDRADAAQLESAHLSCPLRVGCAGHANR